MAEVSAPAAILEVVVPFPIAFTAFTSATRPLHSTTVPAIAPDNVHDTIEDHSQTALVPSTSTEPITNIQHTHGASAMQNVSWYKSPPIALSMQSPAVAIVGGTKGNIRGPQCTVM